VTALSLPADLTVTGDFARTLELIADGQSVFVTGRAGTGKSTLLRLVRENSDRRLAVVAPTGLAAVNVGGQTIHSLFSFPPRLLTPDMIRAGRHARVLRQLELLIIDEISMVRADLMDAIDKSLRIVRKAPETPFGGVQIALFGDPHQLPPVVQGGDVQHYLEEAYGGPYFFNAPAFRDFGVARIELEEVFRQRDADFLTILNSLREGAFTEDTVEALNERVARLADLDDPRRFTVLTTTNAAAQRINLSFLERLPGEVKSYGAQVSGEFSQGAYPTEATLALKVGARVIMLRNDAKGRFVNGSLADIVELDENAMTVAVDGRLIELEPETWDNVHYAFDQRKDKIVETVAGRFKQFAVRLAWALTIHKAQGMTLDYVYVDMGRGAFSHGQTYVALSRCRSLPGLVLARPLGPRDLMFDERALGYREAFHEG